MASLDSKHGELKKFYEFLSNFKDLKPLNEEIKDRNNRVLNNVNQLYIKYFDIYKKNTIVKN